jgi:hypothetical protein
LIRDLDSTSVIPGLTGNLDSTSVASPVDSIAPPRDTTPIRYVHGWNNVKMYRSDIQAACDSMVFCELDSIARLFGRPILWNEVKNQLTAEEMQLLFKGGNFERGSMVTDAWIISEQDSVHFNQIKSTEMQGWFRDNKIYRFDALGGVSAIFYMVEEEVVTTINVKEAKSMTAALKDGTAQRMLYMESIKSDAYPVGDLAPAKQRLKGFEWRADERPASRDSITLRQVRVSERPKYAGVKKPLYRQTNKFFDGYMFDLFEQLDARKRAELERRERERDSLARVAALEEMALEKEAAVDSVAVEPVDSVVVVVPVEVPERQDTVVAIAPLADTAAVQPMRPDEPVTKPQEPVIQRETPSVAPETPAVASPETVVVSEKLTRAEKRALRKAERKARRELRRAARLARRQARRNSRNHSN